ncbi:MAG: caspase family protein [Candidatus Hydrogenedentes bacterium]|nr:caspase family protein [Candidatus Hydrogenedentota bacterium]
MGKRRPVAVWGLVLLVACDLFGAPGDPVLVIDPHGHSGRVNDLACTPDGRTLISVSDDKAIRFWDVGTGILVKTLRGQAGAGPEGQLFAAALSPDGRFLAVGGYGTPKGDTPIQIIDIAADRQVGTLSGHTNTVNALAWSADGRYLASGSADTDVRIWDVGGVAEKPEGIRCVATLEGHTDDVYDVDFAPDGSALVSASYDHSCRLWRRGVDGSFESGNSKVMEGHSEGARCVVWSPKGDYIVSGGHDERVLLWDRQGDLVKELGRLSGKVVTVSFLGDGSRVVGAGSGNPAVVFEVPSGAEVTRFEGHSNTVYSAIPLSGDWVASAGGDDHEIRIWDAQSGTEQRCLVGKGRPVWAAGFGPGLKVGFGQKNKFADENNRGPIEQAFDFAGIALDPGPIPESQYHRAQRTLGPVSIRQEGEYKLVVGEDVVIEADARVDGRILYSAFTPSGQVVIGRDFSLKLYSGAGELLHEFVGHMGIVWAVSVSQDGRLLASASDDQTVRLWSLDSRELLATLFVAEDHEWVCWTPQGYYAASAGGEQYLGWQINRGWDQLAEFYPAYSYRRRFYRPELVQRTAELHSFDRAWAELQAAEPEKEMIASPKTLMPPEIMWEAPVQFRVETEEAHIPIRAVVTAGEKLTEIKVLVNGRVVADMADLQFGADDAERQKVVVFDAPLEAGENTIEIYAAHLDANALSAKKLVTYHHEDPYQSDLYLVNIGISRYADPSLSLNFADADAESLAQLFETQRGRLFRKVEVRPLVNDNASRDAILGALEWVESQATQKDVVILSVAAHGYNENGNYYLLPYEGDPEKLRSTAVNWRDLVDVLGNLPSKNLVIVDSCHSGALPDFDVLTRGDRVNNTEALRELASPQHGVVVMASCTGREVAQERESLGHGVFTHAILEGLRDKMADQKKDGIIYAHELSSFVMDRVKELSNGKQHPTTPGLENITRFPLFQLEN